MNDAARSACGLLRALVVPASVVGSMSAYAHVVEPARRGSSAVPLTGLASSSDAIYATAWIVVPLALTGAFYAAGVLRLWRATAVGRGVRPRDVALFALGWTALAGALLGPLDAWAARSFAAHMLQHEALMLVAAPLLVHGRPLAAWTWALSERGRQRARVFIAIPAWRHAWRWLTRPLGATITQLAVLFVWHVPVIFNHAATHAGVHTLQHVSFLASALCFWWATRASHSRISGAAGITSGVAIACVFVTMIATGALGALLTFAPTPWYAGFGGVAVPWASSAVEDQQLGGLLMWVPGGTVYLVAALHHAWRLLAREPVMRRSVVMSPPVEGTTR